MENCSCEVPCPCTVSLDLGADYDRCNALLVFQIASGQVEGVDVGGLTVAAVGDTPKVMSEGNWRLGVLMDENASDEQAEKLGAVFGGQLGGPMEALGPLIGENLGMERVPIEVLHENGTHSVRFGGGGGVTVQDVVPFGKENGEPARLDRIFHPAGETLTIARATESQFSASGWNSLTRASRPSRAASPGPPDRWRPRASAVCGPRRGWSAGNSLSSPCSLASRSWPGCSPTTAWPGWTTRPA